MKYIKPADNKDIQIRVVIMPDMKDDKPVITTNITIFDKRIKAGEVSSKDMSELEFNKLIYEIQREYGIKKCNLGKSREMQNELETINTVLRPTFQLAVRDDIIRKNPVDGAYCEVKKRNGGARKTRRALTVDQQRKFMEYVAKNPFFYHWYPFFVFLLGTGCRIGEAIGIRWDDIDLENRVIDINHSLTYYQRADDSYKCEFRVSLPKTEAGNRRIPMMQQVYDVLQEEYERQKQEGFCVENVDGMTNFVFTNRFGMPHNPGGMA